MYVHFLSAVVVTMVLRYMVCFLNISPLKVVFYHHPGHPPIQYLHETLQLNIFKIMHCAAAPQHGVEGSGIKILKVLYSVVLNNCMATQLNIFASAFMHFAVGHAINACLFHCLLTATKWRIRNETDGSKKSLLLVKGYSKG